MMLSKHTTFVMTQRHQDVASERADSELQYK